MDTVWIIDYKDIKEYKVKYCRPYNDHHCLVIKDFFPSKGTHIFHLNFL